MSDKISDELNGSPAPEPEEEYCHRCEDGGWVERQFSQHPPEFEICPECFNPKGNPCP